MPRAAVSGFALVAITAIELSACAALKNPYKPPELDVPAAFRTEVSAPSGTLSPEWWREFGSAQLASLVGQAEAENLDIAAAVARIRQADAQLRIAGAALLPNVGLGANASRNKSGKSISSASSSPYNLLDLQLSASYEIDFWGKNQAAVDYAKLSATASGYARDTIALTTAASVATTYFQILALRDEITVTTANLQAAEEILGALRAQEQAGTTNELSVAEQETTVASLRAQIPPLEQSLRQFTDALAVLVARPPEELDINSGTLDGLSNPVVAAGLPSDLLQRRPDVVESEAQLKAANANITVARAAFYPSIQLTAQGGFESTALSSLFGPAGLLYSLAAGITQPIFSGGSLEGQLQYSKAVYDELLQDYRKSVLTAFQNVEDALIATQKTEDEEKAQTAAVVTAQRAYGIALAQLRSGTIDVLTALNTETALFTARNLLVQAKLARLNASVSLFNAVGGGWTKPGDSNA